VRCHCPSPSGPGCRRRMTIPTSRMQAGQLAIAERRYKIRGIAHLGKRRGPTIVARTIQTVRSLHNAAEPIISKSLRLRSASHGSLVAIFGDEQNSDRSITARDVRSDVVRRLRLYDR
jgi:hypothetical protein